MRPNGTDNHLIVSAANPPPNRLPLRDLVLSVWYAVLGLSRRLICRHADLRQSMQIVGPLCGTDLSARSDNACRSSCVYLP